MQVSTDKGKSGRSPKVHSKIKVKGDLTVKKAEEKRKGEINELHGGAKRLCLTLYGAAACSAAANLYIGLSTTAINNDSTGITEPDPLDAYARVEVTNDATEWPNATAAGRLSNRTNELSFPTATDSWGTVTHFFFSTDPPRLIQRTSSLSVRSMCRVLLRKTTRRALPPMPSLLL